MEEILKCKCCGHKDSWEKWRELIGLFDRRRIKPFDPNQFVECPMCYEMLCIDYDLLDVNTENVTNKTGNSESEYQ